MAEPHLVRRLITGLSVMLIALFSVTVVAAPADTPQPQIESLDQRITRLEASRAESVVGGQLERLALQLDVVNTQLTALKTQLDQDKTETRAGNGAPAVAWVALMVVGVAFALAWGVVGSLREGTRRKEIAIEGELKKVPLVLSAQQTAEIDQKVETRASWIVVAVKDILAATHQKPSGGQPS